MHDPLEIRHLRYFLAVAEAGSFSRAADRLGISQPSVSQQMRDLEAGLRVSLFQRRGKRILLTSTGLIFQEHARALLRELENFLQEVSSEPGRLRGTLRLGVVPVLNVPLLPELMGMFAADHPGISLIVEEISSTEIETALEEGRMDVGLGFLTRHSPNLRYERLCTDEFALIVSETHPWSKRHVVQLSELHQQRLLQLPDSFVMRRMMDEICRNHQVRPRHRCGNQCDRNVASFARAFASGNVDAEDRITRKRKSEIKGDPASGKKARIGHRSLAVERFGSK